LLAGAALFGLTLLFAFNPMALGFKTRFSVVNRLDEPVFVTPVGAIGQDGWRSTLPMLLPGPAYLPAPRARQFSIEPGESREFWYDWDDIQFSEILVLTARGSGMIIVDPTPTLNQYSKPARATFQVDRHTMATRPTAEVLRAARRSGRAALEFAIFVLAAPAVLLVGVALIAASKQARQGVAA
jgi:hypothetical protein